MEKNLSTKKEQNCSVNFLRFVIIMIICYAHQMHQELAQYNSAYIDIRLNLAGMGVECFFIMAGYFLFFTKKSTLVYIKDRIIRLWPLMALSLAVVGLFTTFDLLPISLRSPDFNTLLFLQSTGISQGPGLNGVAWYVCVLFWVSILYVLIKRIPNQIIQNVIVSALVIWSFLMIWLPGGDLLYTQIRGFSPYFGGHLFSILLLRGIYAIGLGFLLASIQKNEVWANTNKKNMTMFECILFVILFGLLLKGYGYLPLCVNNLLIMAVFMMLFTCFINNAGYLSSKVLNLKIFNLLGAWSYSIYIMQNVMFYLTRYLATKSNIYIYISTHPKITITLSLLMYILIGVAAYYFIEFLGFIINKISTKLLENKKAI